MIRVSWYFLSVSRPDVELARGGARTRAPRLLEPGMLVRGVVDDELGHDPQAALVRRPHEAAEVAHRAVARIDAAVVGDVVAVVPERRGVERHHPDRRDAEVLDVIELPGDAFEIADAVVVRIEERLDVQLIEQRVAVPLRVAAVDHERQRDGGMSRQIATGRSRGSSAIRCVLPWSVNPPPSRRSSHSMAAWSGRPNSHNGTS